MKRLFVKIIYWLMIFLILLIPVFFIMKYNTKEYLDIRIPSLGVAAIMFVFLFAVFKYIRPQIENFFERRRRYFIANLDDLFNAPVLLSESIKQKDFRESLFETLIGGFVSKFGIVSAHCFLLNKNEKKFMLAYSTGEKIPDAEIIQDSPLIQLLFNTPGIVYKSALNYPRETQDRRIALEFFIRNRLEAILPCMNPEKQMIGLIALGGFLGNKKYSTSFLTALELYRIQFQHKLANALMLEQVRTQQVDKHDRMVVSSTKNKIIPSNMSQVNDYRISSLYISNSQYGGDYFDSVRLDENRVALFMADSSYSGVDSAIISLELYGVLHSHMKLFDSPNKILDNMNWVMVTSKYSNKFAPAICVILSSTGELSYSNATFNPLMLYKPEDNTITEFGTKGIPLGADKKSKYESTTILLKPGSVGILYSNGMAYAINKNGEAYSTDRIKSILRSGAQKSPADLTRIINSDVTNFIQEQDQMYDMSAIIFKFQ
jgi:serine phosphatase RsbU (regulator of sigma subunit)